MDLAQEVTTNKTYIWKGYKTWKKNKGYEKIQFCKIVKRGR